MFTVRWTLPRHKQKLTCWEYPKGWHQSLVGWHCLPSADPVINMSIPRKIYRISIIWMCDSVTKTCNVLQPLLPFLMSLSKNRKLLCLTKLINTMPPFCYLHFLGSKSPILVHMNGQGLIVLGKDSRSPASLEVMLEAIYNKHMQVTQPEVRASYIISLNLRFNLGKEWNVLICLGCYSKTSQSRWLITSWLISQNLKAGKF